jgi:hypothetical protein
VIVCGLAKDWGVVVKYVSHCDRTRFIGKTRSKSNVSSVTLCERLELESAKQPCHFLNGFLIFSA